jgi:hypothetical protein
MWCVGCDFLGSSDKDFASFPEHADRLRQKQPAIPMQPAHHAFFKSRCASNQLSLKGPQP